MDRRRLLMNAFSFPDNYLFKEGKGFKDKIAHYIYDLNGAGGYTDNDNTVINGGVEYDGYILLSNEINWEQWSSNTDPNTFVLKSDSFDLSEYKTLKVEMACYSTTSRPHSIAIINEEKINISRAEVQKGYISQRPVSSDIFSAGESFYDTTETRQIYSLDISNVDVGTICIKTGDSNRTKNTIYNIWLE